MMSVYSVTGCDIGAGVSYLADTLSFIFLFTALYRIPVESSHPGGQWMLRVRVQCVELLTCAKHCYCYHVLT